MYPGVLLSVVLLGLLSGCAYIEGRKADQENMSAPVAAKNHGQVIQAEEPAQPLSDTAPNPATGASKIIAPVTQAVGNL